MVHDLAHEITGGRWLLTGGGGYDWCKSCRDRGLTCSP